MNKTISIVIVLSCMFLTGCMNAVSVPTGVDCDHYYNLLHNSSNINPDYDLKGAIGLYCVRVCNEKGLEVGIDYACGELDNKLTCYCQDKPSVIVKETGEVTKKNKLISSFLS